MSEAALNFNCPGCGNQKIWKPQIAGRRAKCSCGQIVTVPAEPPRATIEPLSYEDAFEAAAADEPEAIAATALMAGGSTLPKSTVFTPPPVVIEREEADGSVSQVGGSGRTVIRSDTAALPRRKGLQREEPAAPPAISPFRDFLLPGVLIAGGVALCMIDATYLGDGTWKPFAEVAGLAVLNIVVSLALAIGAVFLASAMGGVAFHEPVPLIIYKLCAAAIAPGAVGSLALHYVGGINGDMAGAFVSLGCYFALFFALFRLSMSDQFVCVVVIFIVRTGVNYAVFRFQGAKGNSWL